jgi:hypothetical protein
VHFDKNQSCTFGAKGSYRHVTLAAPASQKKGDKKGQKPNKERSRNTSSSSSNGSKRQLSKNHRKRDCKDKNPHADVALLLAELENDESHEFAAPAIIDSESEAPASVSSEDETGQDTRSCKRRSRVAKRSKSSEGRKGKKKSSGLISSQDDLVMYSDTEDLRVELEDSDNRVEEGLSEKAHARVHTCP